MFIIGLVGFIGSGKGTAGDILENKGFKKCSFASPVKDAVSLIFNWDREMLEGINEKSREWREQPDLEWSKKFGYEFSPRHALQLMGTEVGRNIFHTNLWIFSLFNRYKEEKNIVITDVRFKNEINEIKKNNGIIIRINRGENPDWYPIAERANNNDPEAIIALKKLNIHQSEWDWIGSDFDYVVENNESKYELEKSLSDILTKIE